MSRTAAIQWGKPLRTQLEAARNMGMVKVLGIAAIGVAFLGGLGIAASMVIDRYKNGRIASQQTQVLTNYFREQIATQLGKSPESVTSKDLELAARVNPAFRQALEKVKQEKSSADRAALLTAGGAYAAGTAAAGLGWLPVGGGIAYMASKFAVDSVGAIVGGTASQMMNKDVLYAQEVIEHIDAKVKQSEPITAFDVMLLRIAQNEAFQAEIKKRGNKPFHKMSEAEQRLITAAMPELYEAAERDAAAVNQGRIMQQDLLVASPGAAQQSGWASKVGGARAPRGSFVQAVEASRATAALPQRG
jgi:hypothetical protein